MTKITLMAVLIFLLVRPNVLSAAEPARPDGTWWQALTADQKIVAVQSLIAGYRIGFFEGHFIQLGIDMKKASKAAIDQMKFAERLRFSKSVETYVIDINSFYDKYPDLRHLDVSNLVSCMDRHDYNCDKMAQSIRSNMTNFHPTTTPP
jgi:hypothetical protein